MRLHICSFGHRNGWSMDAGHLDRETRLGWVGGMHTRMAEAKYCLLQHRIGDTTLRGNTVC